MDGAGIAILLVIFGSLFVLARGGSRRDEILRRGHESRIDRELHRTTSTDVTGVLRCRRCGAEGSEGAGVCARCGATL